MPPRGAPLNPILLLFNRGSSGGFIRLWRLYPGSDMPRHVGRAERILWSDQTYLDNLRRPLLHRLPFSGMLHSTKK